MNCRSIFVIIRNYFPFGNSRRIIYSLTKNVVWLVLSGYELTGLARGGEQLAKLKRNYAKAVELLVELASLQVRPAEASLAWLLSHVGTSRACAGAHSVQMALCDTSLMTNY